MKHTVYNSIQLPISWPEPWMQSNGKTHMNFVCP